MKSLFCKKNYILYGLAALSLSLAITSHVFAGEATSTDESATTSEEESVETEDEDAADESEEESPQSNLPIRAQENREAAQERVEEKRALITEQMQNRLINLGRNMKARMEAAIDRMEQIIARFERRLNKLAGEGVSTEAAQANIDEAKESLLEASAILESIDNEVIRAVSSDNPRPQFLEVKRKFQAARNFIIDAHRNLKEAVLVLKNPNRMGESETATTTATTTEETSE